MAIDLTTPILGPVDTDILTLFNAFKGNKYSDDIVHRFASALVLYSNEFGIRASIVAGQIAKETGYFKFGGQVQSWQFNLAGLGATNGGAAGLSYPDIETGVRAVFTHHLVYFYGNVLSWPAYLRQYQALDQRYDAVMSTGRAGTVKVLGDYTNGNWAYSPQYPVGSLANGYANGIAAIANTLSNGGTPVAEQYPTLAELGFAVRIEPQRLGFFGRKRGLEEILWWIQHDTEGYYEGDISTLTRTNAGSVHFIIGREWGQLTASVPIDTTAWTPGNDPIAELSVNVEMSGFRDGRDGGYTDWQYFCNGVIFRWCQSQGMANVPVVYIGRDDADGGPLPDDPGILGHDSVPNPKVPGAWGGAFGHTDPGPLWDWNRMIAEIGNAAPQPHPIGSHTVDGMTLGEGFWQVWNAIPEANDTRLRVLGKLLETDHDEWLRLADGRVIPVVVSRWERDNIIWDRGATPAPWDVRMPLLTETLLRKPPAAVRRFVTPTKNMCVGRG